MAPSTTPDTRRRILLTAMELFAAKGYGSTSVSDILSRSQANSGSLYHFFPGKQDVLIGVLEMYRDGIQEMLLDPAWRGVEDPVERVFALLAAYRGMLLESECLYGCPIGSLALEIHEPDPPVRELLAQNFTNWTTAIQGCLNEAGLPGGVDRKGLAEFILTTMEGAVMQARTHREIGYFDRSIEQLRQHMALLTQRALA
uniref:TetR/AcrR family transcriptional regulator n=1 Tax=uncultured Caulobacter sp. TaxID=158749 RepID=UPI0025E20384|nr:TetR/AcrR family transcriptional regulator [uncultured Caulobacter sp.]